MIKVVTSVVFEIVGNNRLFGRSDIVAALLMIPKSMQKQSKFVIVVAALCIVAPA